VVFKVVLPLAPLLGFSMYFIVQFLQNINPDVRPNIRRTLILLGSVILPISFIVAEAFKDGHRFHPQYVSDLHSLFSVIAFLSLIIFQIIASLQLPKARGMLFLALLPVFIIVFQYFTHIQNINCTPYSLYSLSISLILKGSAPLFP
jgi:drug/metabolite transporter superfamily protein YnfA